VTAPDALDVHPANHEQWRAWDGTEGAYWAAHADEFDRSVARYTGPFLDAAGIAPGERVLDIGCGTGERRVRRPVAHPAVPLSASTSPRSCSTWRGARPIRPA
jgi:SAM-dependent methyltransferase